MRNTRTYLALPTLLVSGLSLLMACSSEPTTPSSQSPSFVTSATHLSISGPGKTTQLARKGYSWTAYMAASYPNFGPWGVRTCPTSSVSTCTSPWSTVYGTTHDTYYSTISWSLAGDCSGGGTRSFQVRAQASAFAIPTETAYFVTMLCPSFGT
jgi:hypothetical protein